MEDHGELSPNSTKIYNTLKCDWNVTFNYKTSLENYIKLSFSQRVSPQFADGLVFRLIFFLILPFGENIKVDYRVRIMVSLNTILF